MSVQLSAWIPGQGTVTEVARPFKFPGGELHLKDVREFDHADEPVWIADVRGADLEDLMTASLLSDVARFRNERFVLMLPYLPAARADRGIPAGGAMYAEFVNTMRADEVIVIDPHSEVVPGFVNNVHTLDGVELVERAIEGNVFNGVIAPDAGAGARALRVAAHLGLDLYQAHKKRDFDTGKLLSYEMDSSLPMSGKYLVVDDICDGGGTFKLLADASGLFRDQLSLWVTHGIFSGNANTLGAYYKDIFTTDSHPGRKLGVATVIVPTFHYMLRQMTGFK
jgi:ribose-phosphate pyrophosphokinase